MTDQWPQTVVDIMILFTKHAWHAELIVTLIVTIWQVYLLLFACLSEYNGLYIDH